MSITDALKKLAVKLGVASSADAVEASNITDALKQVAVGLGVSDDPVKIPGTSVSDVIEVMAENIQPTPGGNPNYVQTINGTWADPWGDVDSAELARAISDRSATAYFRMPNIGYMPVNGEADEVTGILMVSVTTVEAGTPPDLMQLVWVNDVFEAVGYDREAGTCVDRTDSYSSYESTVTIIWHPLPEQ